MLNNVLLANIYHDDNTQEMEEIGLGYIASYLRSKDYQVFITSGLEGKLDYEEIIKFSPRVVGVSLYTKNKKAVYRFISKVKALLPDVYVVAGGYLATYNDEDVLLENININAIIRGEGELAFFDLMQHIEGKKSIEDVGSLSYIYDGGIIRNKNADLIADLSEMPFPARDCLLTNKLSYALVSTSRGCVANCHFCIARSYWKKWRGRNIPSIVDELKYLNNMGVNKINFVDTSFEDPDAKCQRMFNIAKAIVENNIKIRYYTDIRAEFYLKSNDELINMLKKSGLAMVLIGIESGNRDDMLLYGKLADIEDNKKCLDYMKEKGIYANIGFINLNPYSNTNTLRQNVDFLDSVNFMYDIQRFLNRYALSKGCKLYEKIEADGLLMQGSYDEIYKYRYINSYVKELHDYLYDKVNKNVHVYRFFALHNYYMLKIKSIELAFIQDEEMSDHDILLARGYITENTCVIDEELKKAGQINKIFLHELIDLCEKGWNCQAAELISERFMRVDDMNQIKKRISFSNQKLYKNLMKSFYNKKDIIDGELLKEL